MSLLSSSEPPLRTAHRAVGWLLPPLIVLLLGAWVTFALWRVETQEAEALVQTKTLARVQEVTVAIQNRMTAYEQVLRGGASLIATLGTVTRDQWHDYVAQLKVQHNYPGFQGIGYAAHVPAARKEAFVQHQRLQGLSSYDIRPPGERDTYAPVTYLEPRSERNLKAHGFDMWAEPVRRVAMELARDTGEPAITGKLKLASEAAQSASFGFLLYIPVYAHGNHPDSVAARREQLQGFVNSPFRMDDLLKGPLGHNPDGMQLRIHDGRSATADSLMFSSHPSPASPDQDHATLAHTALLNVHGRDWLMVFEFPYAASRPNPPPENLVLLTGGVISLLLAALTWAAMARLRLIKRSERHYHALANFDPLTTLANRARFQDELEACVQQSTLTHRPFALLFIDLDHFKDVNDTLGHHWGDKLLQQVAQRLKAHTRNADTVARLGGDEFTVILPDMADKEGAARVAQTLLEALAQPYPLEGEPHLVSASIGITLFPQDAAGSAELLQTADQAMYTAKRLGRNRYQLYSPNTPNGRR